MMTITGRTARYEAEQVDEATGVVEQYVEPDTLAPRPAFDLNVLALRKVAADPNRKVGFGPDEAWGMYRVQELLARKANFDRFGQAVCLHEGDVEPSDELWPNMAVYHTDRPRIVFVSVTGNDVGLQQMAGHDVCGAAVYFDPSLVGRIPVERPSGQIDPQTGKELWVQKYARNPAGDPIPMTQPDRFNPAGYVSVVRFFSTIPQLTEAQAELARAVEVIDAPPWDGEEPEFGSLDEAANVASAGDWNTL
jgi:hypothetical protein